MILSGKELSKKIKLELKEKIKNNMLGLRPVLEVIIVGDNPASKVYVAQKEKACAEVGILSIITTLPESISQEDLLKHIQHSNNEHYIHGILVQLPLPKHIDERVVIEAISRDKDVDGFHPGNVADLWLNKKGCMTDFTIPCTPKGIIKLLEEANIAVGGKEVVVIGRSNIVGLPIAKLLLDRNATVTIAHSKTLNLEEVTNRADIIIVATGQPRMLKNWMVKEGAVVIDVGVNRDIDGKLCGDVDFDNVQYVASYITKVPGGVGPMTIACLMENTFELFKKQGWYKEDQNVSKI